MPPQQIKAGAVEFLAQIVVPGLPNGFVLFIEFCQSVPVIGVGFKREPAALQFVEV